LQLNKQDATYAPFLREEMMGSSTDAQKNTEAFARRAEQEAKRDAIVKARLQAEADSIDAKTMRLRALRMAQEGRAYTSLRDVRLKTAVLPLTVEPTAVFSDPGRAHPRLKAVICVRGA
jgi:hypothetical protein